MTTRKTKTGTTREERKLLKDAGEIIRRELANGQEVHIRGLGWFNVGTTKVNVGIPGEGNGKQRIIGIVRFRPFDALKKAVRDIGAREPEDNDTAPVVVTKSETPAPKRVPKVKPAPTKPAAAAPVRKINW